MAPTLNVVRSHLFPTMRVAFAPQRPLRGEETYADSPMPRGAVAHVLCRLLGGKMVACNAPRPGAASAYDVAFRYNRATRPGPAANSPFAEEPVINAQCTDVRKCTVNAAFEAVFGYSVGVDPTRHCGPMVVKSNENGTHDGRVVEGPMAPEAVSGDVAYQKVVNNRVGRQVMDYRVPVHGSMIPLVYRKYRPDTHRFRSFSTHTALERPEAVFSRDERTGILQVADRLGMDFGEMDVLRDASDGRVYVVDANPTPWGPPRGLDLDGRKAALARLKPSFECLLNRFAE